MIEFFMAEWARFEANPVGQLASWIGLFGVVGIAVARPLVRFPVAFVGTAKLIQFVVIAAIGAVIASALQASVAAHAAMYAVTSLVMLRVIMDNWTSDEALGPVTTYVAYNGFCIALAGANQMMIVGCVFGSFLLHLFGSAFNSGSRSASAPSGNSAISTSPK